MKRCNSEKIYSDACAVIPGGVNSPVRAFYGLEMTPFVAVEGEGDILVDADGHRFIDYCGSWGALILGHAHPQVVAAAYEQLKKGSTFGATTELEERLASRIVKHIPSMQKVRFVSTGTEAAMSAARLARGFTGKRRIIKFEGNYHGHADIFLQDAEVLPFNDLEAAAAFFSTATDIAAVIIEPIAGNMAVRPANREFLELLCRQTQRIGALLIFDEVITGFRVGLGGAQELYGIQPDLTLLAKIIGGGFPAAAFGGRGDIMDHLAPLGKVFQAGTLSGNPIAMKAGLATLDQLTLPGFYEDLQRKADLLLKPLQGKIEIHAQGSMFSIEPSGSFPEFFKFLFNRGIYIPPAAKEAWFISCAHTDEHLQMTTEAILQYLQSQ